ncbi:hypothetical protein ACS0TY_023035 [Phlomoides rotata]
MNGKSNNKTGSINAFDFDLGLGSGRSRPLNDQRNQTPAYSSTTYTYSSAQQKPKTTSSSWTHQPAPSVGSLSGPTSMVGDISGKSWNSTAPPSSGVSSIGIVNNKNPNLFGDLLGSAMSQNKGNNNVPLKKAAPVASQNTFSMGSMANSLPKTNNSGNTSGTWGSSNANSGGSVSFGGNNNRSSSVGANNVNLGGISNRNSNLGGPSMKGMAGGGVGGGAMGSSKDPFGSLVDFASKPSASMNAASKTSGNSGFGDESFGDFQNAPAKSSGSSYSTGAFPTSNSDPLGDFGFGSASVNQSQPPKQSSGANDFDALFSSTLGGSTGGSEGFTSQQFTEGDDWGMDSEFGGNGTGGTTTELDGLPPPPAGVSGPAAKSKGMDNYKQGQFADAIKWLSWAVILLEKVNDDDGAMEVLTSRASCYKEVGEYKKAVADCTKVLERDGKNASVLVQRALLYESMEKYKLGAEDLRTVMNIDPGNRVARSTIHRLIKMAE